MFRIGLRDTRAHFRRFIMSIIAIALGVAFVVGSFCFREMLNDQISQMMGSNSDADVYVRGATEQKKDGEDSFGSYNSTYNEISTDIIPDIEKVDGVVSADATHQLSNAVLLDHNGDAMATIGAPTLVIGVDEHDPWRSAHFASGGYPQTDSEIALLQDTADKAGLKTGDKAKLIVDGEAREMTVSGVFTTYSSQLGAILILARPGFVEHTLQQENEDTSSVQSIGVYGSKTTPLDETAQQQLADRINQELPKSVDAHAVTGDSVRDDETKSIQDQLGFIQPLILIFAAIALFVGAFIIANTFTMIVRESMRGYALLRSVGASPLQVFASVLVQAVILGLVGSGIGVLLGWGLLELIARGMTSSGMPLSGSPAPSTTDVIIGVIVGVVVTIIGATLPAKTAATAPPIQAMNETVNPEKPVKARGWIGIVMVAVGAAWWVLCYLGAAKRVDWQWLKDLGSGWTLGLGAGFVVIGAIVCAPAFVAPAAKVLGWIPSKMFPVTGELATRNIGRAKRRTANTAAALFIGVAIVSCLGVVASSMKTSVSDLVDNNVNADYVAMTASMTQPISTKAVDEIEKTEGVGAVSAIYMLPTVKATNAGDDVMTAAIRSDLLTKLAPIEQQEGDAAKAIDAGEAAVGRTVADDEHFKVGDTVDLESENVVVDEQATKQASEAYQRQITEQATALQQEAQQLAASGDVTGAQNKAKEAESVVKQAQNVDPKQFVKTKTETKTEKVRIGAIIDDSLYADSIFVSLPTAEKATGKDMMMVTQMYVQAKPGANVEQLGKDLKKTVKPFYTISVLTRDEFKSSMSSMINSMLAIIYALLALSIIIAIFGIVNTLALNVSERTKEIGLLRAIGTSNGQVRGMLAIEAVILSVFGTLVGIVVGVAAGVVIRIAYESQGMTTLTIPWDQLVLFLIVAILVGLIASISPARRALKHPVLNAVASE
ncbi:ABC transporter permease [Bifidobacterium animalis subsp. lactis]|uniref:ABC transporter permease n=1 Tax=Bifidobacterium animalis TaxID=28025 RepID=UPI001020950F|nr:FtsX-like permease family protein [Bifidobacterium animalis]RYM92333.1 ABC transporter permease [Bifidobacterium animalis subsp. lactis]RYM92448.1 ABC transporter permease [Bifidobacterium animalis subsp. lactis]